CAHRYLHHTDSHSSPTRRSSDLLISNDEVAKSLPAGTLSLAGTEPTCTAVEDGVEYHCVLSKPPAPEVSDWKGTVEPTVDATKQDRKSTRLNSSHQIISYAVFCL